MPPDLGNAVPDWGTVTPNTQSRCQCVFQCALILACRRNCQKLGFPNESRFVLPDAILQKSLDRPCTSLVLK